MKIVFQEEILKKIDENTNRIVENIISEFNERKNQDAYCVSKNLYHGLNERCINIVVYKLNEILKDYNYNAVYEYFSIIINKKN